MKIELSEGEAFVGLLLAALLTVSTGMAVLASMGADVPTLQGVATLYFFLLAFFLTALFSASVKRGEQKPQVGG